MTEFDSSAINWQWVRYQDLSVEQLAEMFQLRQRVFIVEQDCPYLDIDGKDPDAIHLLAWYDGTLVATLRLFPQYKDYQNQSSLGRICSHPDYRRFNIGRNLVQHGVDYIDQHYADRNCQIGAQLYLKKFYESFGFSQNSEPYDEDGIPHILMVRPAGG
ncbi:MAG: GNAT family N-acetyltransferase [Kangiellaceae bacterium]|jgi:ElaA protein|nr:GNAT family N-acetyltransferase [Kangiellaceae bacterium]